MYNKSDCQQSVYCTNITENMRNSMKIVYIVKDQLHYYPPCVSQIRMLNNLGYSVDVLFGSSDPHIVSILEQEGINCYKIESVGQVSRKLIIKLRTWIIYRINVVKMMKNYPKGTIFWFGNAESVMPLKGCLKKVIYICSFLELLDEFKPKIRFLRSIANKAVATTVCEETRGYLQAYWWGLTRLPFVFPNKPYTNQNNLSDKDNDLLMNAFKMIDGRPYILYQGILQNKKELVQIAKALNYTKNHYVFVLMGIDKYGSIADIKKAYGDVVYIEYIPAPLHLEITKNAHIGVAYYRPDSLNKVFCAPNKIYEYSGYGVPMICNNIPGLRNTVGSAKAAKCIDLNYTEITKAIDDIDTCYREFQEYAKSFYDSTDNVATMKSMMSYIESII